MTEGIDPTAAPGATAGCRHRDSQRASRPEVVARRCGELCEQPAVVAGHKPSQPLALAQQACHDSLNL
eukprot:scaffold2296_cov88-Phaeocystis_antarctica.AAC.4